MAVVRAVVVEGIGIHTGEGARVTLSAGTRGAPVCFRIAGEDVPLARLSVASTLRATTVGYEGRAGEIRIGTVEHLLAALAGLGVYAGLVVEVEGPELPLLDGGASAWVVAVGRLALPRRAPALRITRPEVIDVGASRYVFRPGESQNLEVVVELDDPRLIKSASWSGDAVDFAERIAPARTFALARDAEALLAAGLARHVDPASVVLVTDDAIHTAGAPLAPDEPARHKLLDLMGDLYLRGGPPLGNLHATRPGHSANAEACRIALEAGVLEAS
jgi:UDP-3-O-[3-hydroxymyristoyl] N-acetylglucosamine deacetylase